MNQRIHVTAVTWPFVCSLIKILPPHHHHTTTKPPPPHHHTTTTTPHHHTTMICCNKYNFCSSISRNKDEVLKEEDTKTNDWQIELKDKYSLDLRSNSSEELQRTSIIKNMRPEIDSRERN